MGEIYSTVLKVDGAGGRCSDAQLVLLLPHREARSVSVNDEGSDAPVALGEEIKVRRMSDTTDSGNSRHTSYHLVSDP